MTYLCSEIKNIILQYSENKEDSNFISEQYNNYLINNISMLNDQIVYDFLEKIKTRTEETNFKYYISKPKICLLPTTQKSKELNNKLNNKITCISIRKYEGCFPWNLECIPYKSIGVEKIYINYKHNEKNKITTITFYYESDFYNSLVFSISINNFTKEKIKSNKKLIIKIISRLFCYGNFERIKDILNGTDYNLQLNTDSKIAKRLSTFAFNNRDKF